MTILPNVEFGLARLPIIHQTQAAECGLVCLAMIAGYHRYRTDLPTLRARFSLSLKGSNLAQIVDYADGLHLASRPLRLEVDEMRELKTPCILHWNLNHFVVLKKADHKGIVIHDPAFGARRLPYAEVTKHFTGVALELTPNVEFKAANVERRVSIRGLMGKVDGLWRSLGLVFAMALALEVFALVSPMFNQWVVDEALVSGDRDLLNVLVIGFALMLVVQSAISMARGWTVMYLSTHLNLQWVANVFTHLVRLPVAWFEKRHLGDVVSRFGSISTIQQTLTTTFIEALLDGLLTIATLAMMMLYSGKLAMVVLAAVFIYGLLRAVAYNPLREASQENMVLSAKAQSCFLETVRGVQAIKLFGRELDRRSRWLNLTVDSINRNVRTQKFMLWFRIANTTVFGLENLLIFWLGARMVMDGSFTVGMLFAFTSYCGQFTGRMSSLIDKFIEFRMLSLHGERLADIVLEPTEQEVAHDINIGHLVPRIELIDVSFRYGDGDPWVVRHLNLNIEPGESLAIVGPSGCGKSTLVKLLLGLLPPSEGEIRYGGMPIRQLGHRAYRQAVAVVMQDDQLLAGSLAENICFFDPQPDQARIESCAQLAAIHEDIAAMPMGYHTLAGDMGTTLSGGQKQRLLLARALYKAPRVLVLDEATSHLDIERERQVNEAVRALDVTRICVAHRPETIAMAARVVRMNKGVIEHDSRASAAAERPLAALPIGDRNASIDSAHPLQTALAQLGSKATPEGIAPSCLESENI
jgi:ATP-binding cassette subfamily B protein RaxB